MRDTCWCWKGCGTSKLAHRVVLPLGRKLRAKQRPLAPLQVQALHTPVDVLAVLHTQHTTRFNALFFGAPIGASTWHEPLLRQAKRGIASDDLDLRLGPARVLILHGMLEGPSKKSTGEATSPGRRLRRCGRPPQRRRGRCGACTWRVRTSRTPPRRGRHRPSRFAATPRSEAQCLTAPSARPEHTRTGNHSNGQINPTI